MHYPQLSSGAPVWTNCPNGSAHYCAAAAPGLPFASLCSSRYSSGLKMRRNASIASFRRIALAFVERYYGKFEETELDAHWR